MVRGLPIVAGYVPIGFTFGVLAGKAGISALNTMLMSLCVYAGASQLIAVGLIASQAPIASVALTTFVVNLRHMILASAVGRYVGRWRKSQLALFAFHLTDETFGVHAAQFSSGAVHWPAAIATNVTAQTAWVVGTALGVVAGDLIGDVQRVGLDFALPALFVALLTLQVRSASHAGVAVIAAIVAVLLLRAGIRYWHTVVAAVLGAAAGVLLERRASDRVAVSTFRGGSGRATD